MTDKEKIEELVNRVTALESINIVIVESLTEQADTASTITRVLKKLIGTEVKP